MASKEELNNQKNLNNEKQKEISLEKELINLLSRRAGISKQSFAEQQDVSNVLLDQIKQLKFEVQERRTIQSIVNRTNKLAKESFGLGQESLYNEKDRAKLQKSILATENDIRVLEELRLKFAKGTSEFDQDISESLKEQVTQSQRLVGELKQIEGFSDKISENFGVKTFGFLNDIIGSIPGLKTLKEPFEAAASAAGEAAIENEKISELKKLGNKITQDDIKRFGLENQFLDKNGKLLAGAAANSRAQNVSQNVFMTGLKKLGPALKAAFKPLIGLEILMALGQADKELVEVQRNLALSRIEAIGFRAELAEAASASGNINVTTTALLNTFNAINKELGFQGKFNSQNLVTATRLLDVVGLTEQSTANLTAAAEIRGNLLEDEYRTILATSYELQRQTGVQFSNKEILEAVGKVTGQVRANLGANPAAIAEAVTQAKLFGAELDDIVGASKALLDFESSIRNELEAELLLGRNLSLERARLAALTGDQSTLAAELAKNAQDFETFTKLNVIQQDALASALGLQSDQLANILFKQEVQGKTAKELRALGKNELADRLEAQTLQDKFTKSVEKLKSVLVDVVSAFTPILDILGGALELVGKIIQGINSISPALSGALVGAGTGALIGGAPGALIGGAIGLAGGVINTSTASTTLSSPSVSIGSNQDALKKEVQGMRMAFEKYAEKGTVLKVAATSFNNQQKVQAYSVP